MKGKEKKSCTFISKKKALPSSCALHLHPESAVQTQGNTFSAGFWKELSDKFNL